jgi:hypothetical protein
MRETRALHIFDVIAVRLIGICVVYSGLNKFVLKEVWFTHLSIVNIFF